MDTPSLKRAAYLGMAKDDLNDLWYAKYWNPHMKALPKHIMEALVAGPQASQLLPAFEDAALLVEPGYQVFENGFGVMEDGSCVVAALTHMPKVTPSMWDWWFGWHGSDTRRYKLWNPDAHLYACWKDDLRDYPNNSKQAYLNRTSFIDEYVGSAKMSLAIQFVPPVRFGFDEKELSDHEYSTAICGRVGLSEAPIDSGYLIHYVRRTDEGSEMRSRFWLGGKYVSSRNGKEIPSKMHPGNDASMIWQAYSLLVHCSKEMNHLATFLPDIYHDYLSQA